MQSDNVTRRLTPEYRAWKRMRSRCNNPNDNRYAIYGGRGIYVCKRWDSFGLFFEDIGERPSPKHQLDRIDTNGCYCKGNCRWATPLQNSRNKRNNTVISFNGKQQSLSAWAEELKINYATLRHRIKYLGWEIERALTENSYTRRNNMPQGSYIPRHQQRAMSN